MGDYLKGFDTKLRDFDHQIALPDFFKTNIFIDD